MPKQITEKEMRRRLRNHISENYKTVEAYANAHGFNADQTRKALRGERLLSTGMVATVANGRIYKQEVIKKIVYRDVTED